MTGDASQVVNDLRSSIGEDEVNTDYKTTRALTSGGREDLTLDIVIDKVTPKRIVGAYENLRKIAKLEKSRGY